MSCFVNHFGCRHAGTRDGGERRSIVGQTFPTMHGTSLCGRRVTLPKDVQGKFAFLVLSFSDRARPEADAWYHAFAVRFDQNPEVASLVVLIIRGVNLMVSTGLGSESDPGGSSRQRDDVVTVYTMWDNLREALGAGSESDTWVYLLDRHGRVIFQYGGPFEPRRFDAMALILEQAIAKDRHSEQSEARPLSPP